VFAGEAAPDHPLTSWRDDRVVRRSLTLYIIKHFLKYYGVNIY